MRHNDRSIIFDAIPYVATAAGLIFARSAWAAIAMYHAGIVAVLAAGRPRERLRRVGRGWRVKAAAAGGITGGCAGVALWAMWPLIDGTPDGLGATLSRFGLSGGSWWAFAVYYATVHPFVEELYWRGGAPARGSALSWRDALFAGYHVIVLHYFISPLWIGVAFVVLLLTSWLWRLTARRFGGLAVPLVSHAAADASIVLAASLII